MRKSEKTSLYILEKVAPIFNKKGYTATSLSDLTEATGLTKGAIYGNFDSKEDLALQAFRKNARYVLTELGSRIERVESPLAKFYALTNFYREYYDRTLDFGGCPIVNVGVDANHQNKALFDRVSRTIVRLQKNLTQMVQDGIDSKEFRSDLDPDYYGRVLFGMIEGSIFLAMTRRDKQYIMDMMDEIEAMIKNNMTN